MGTTLLADDSHASPVGWPSRLHAVGLSATDPAGVPGQGRDDRDRSEQHTGQPTFLKAERERAQLFVRGLRNSENLVRSYPRVSYSRTGAQRTNPAALLPRSVGVGLPHQMAPNDSGQGVVRALPQGRTRSPATFAPRRGG